MMRRILAAAGLILFADSACWAEVERTSGLQQEWFARFFERTVISACREGSSVHFVSDGGFGVWRESEWLTEFAVAEGGAFLQQPDHHAATGFTVLGIGPGGVDVAYEASFDHRSFGPDRITIDTGTISVPYACGAQPGKEVEGTDGAEPDEEARF